VLHAWYATVITNSFSRIISKKKHFGFLINDELIYNSLPSDIGGLNRICLSSSGPLIVFLSSPEGGEEDNQRA
jgi:long-subunit acyl-CoA synthetase (AMP-forming)